MSKELLIFSNSVGKYISPRIDGADSYIDLLSRAYPTSGIQLNGTTIWDVHRSVPIFLTGNRQNITVIINVGVCECTTVSANQFLIMAANRMLAFGDYYLFQAYIFGKNRKAAYAVHTGKELYLPMLYHHEFISIYEEILIMLQGTKTICVGFSKPNSNHKGDKSIEVNSMLIELCHNYDHAHYFDLYNTVPECVTDNCHYNAEGHKKIYEEINQII